MPAINHLDNLSTNLSSGTSVGATTSPLNTVPSISAPFYMAWDRTNINGHFEVKQVTSKTATNVNHAALTYAHTTDEEVGCVTPAEELNAISAAFNGGPIYDTAGNEEIKMVTTASAVNEITVTNAATGGTPDISATGDDTNISLSLQGKGTGKVEVEMPYGSAAASSTSTTSASFGDVTGASFSFTIKKTSHVKITFNGSIQNNTAVRWINLKILRDAVTLLAPSCHVGQSGVSNNVCLVCVDESLPAGTYTIKLQLAAGQAGDTVYVLSGKLFAEAIIA